MAGLIAPGICRFAVNGTYQGHAVVNIVDMRIDTTGSTEGRGDAANGQAGIVLNEWHDHILTHLVPQYSALSVSWLDLDQADGSTGERTSTAEHTWPSPGRNASSGWPGSVAMRVNKNTTARRGQRQGRMYLCGGAEGYSDTSSPNTMVQGNITAINGDLASFLGNLNQVPSVNALGYASEMVVVHTLGGAYVSSSVVNSLTLAQQLGTQVRRVRG